MRVAHILLAAVSLGLTAGYAWSAMAPHKARLHVPKPDAVEPIDLPETTADKEWAERAQENLSSVDQNVSSTDEVTPKNADQMDGAQAR